jgi:hypothetical protein
MGRKLRYVPWFDRTQEYLARRKGEVIDRLRYATPETVTFSPLPCWKHLSPEAYRQRVATMATEIEEDTAAARKRTGTEPLGAAAILAQDPTSRPKRLKKSPAPLFHAATRPCGNTSTKASPGPWRPTARRPRNSREEIPTPASLSGASRRRCRSSAGSSRRLSLRRLDEGGGERCVRRATLA